MTSWSFFGLPMMLGVVVSAALAVFVSIAAARMQRLESYNLAVTGSIMAMLPIHPLFFVSLPLGLWALITLLRPEVKAAFDERRRMPREAPLDAMPLDAAADAKTATYDQPADGAQGRLVWPVAGILVGGLINVVVGSVGIVTGMVGATETGGEAMVVAPLFLIPILYVGIVVASALSMRLLRWYPLAITGAILMLIPLGPGSLIGIPFGIWALVALTRADVRRTFAQGGLSLPSPPRDLYADWAQGRLIGPMIGIIIGGLLNAAICAMLLGVGIAECMDGRGDDWVPLVLLMGVPLLYVATIIAAAVCMRTLKAYPLALAGAVLALIPLGFGWLVSFPCGIWALIALTRWDVRRAF